MERRHPAGCSIVKHSQKSGMGQRPRNHLRLTGPSIPQRKRSMQRRSWPNKVSAEARKPSPTSIGEASLLHFGNHASGNHQFISQQRQQMNDVRFTEQDDGGGVDNP